MFFYKCLTFVFLQLYLVQFNHALVINDNLKTKQEPNLVIYEPNNKIRSAAKVPEENSLPINLGLLNFYLLKDDHEQLFVHWAGKNSSVIICLAKNGPHSRRKQSSAVYISHNYGFTYEQITFFDKEMNGTNSTIDTFYISPLLNSYYLFMDRNNKCIFVTKNYGHSFQKVDLNFVPKKFQFHHSKLNLILAQSLETNHSDSSLYLSTNFGLTWKKIQNHVLFYSWSVKGQDKDTTIFVQRFEPYGSSSFISSSDFFSNSNLLESWLDHVDKVELHGRFIFATKNINQLWISVDRQPFFQAKIITNTKEILSYYIADVTNEIIFLCITFTDNSTSLFKSLVHSRDYTFTIALKDIVYFNSIVSKIIPGKNYEIGTKQEFADFHPIDGVRGRYIVSKWKNKNHKSISDIITLITYDMGETWHTLKAPAVDSFGQQIHCNYHNHSLNKFDSIIMNHSKNCSLHLTQRFLSMNSNSKAILTRPSSLGFILATGVIGDSLKGKQNIYLSLDAGMSWREILSGNYLYAIGDFGGIIVAVEHFSYSGATNILYYSTDYGKSFSNLRFFTEKILVYQLLTEPGETNAIFTIYGSKEKIHEWIVIQVNLTSVFTRNCKMPKDYSSWLLLDSQSNCILGETQYFYHRLPTENCFIGSEISRPAYQFVCACKYFDYECDIGYHRQDDPVGFKCIKDNTIDDIPDYCLPGQIFNKSTGLRKIAGNKCHDVFERYIEVPCPFNQSNSPNEFILFVQRQDISLIHIKDLIYNNTKKYSLLPKKFLSNAIAADFDTENHCLFWSDLHYNRIYRYCFDGKQISPDILVHTDLESVEGIAYNQINGQLYFTNGHRSKVELINTRTNNQMRRTILKQPHLTNPRGIVIDPIECFIFVTDWSSASAIIRSDLDGQNVKVLFNSQTVTWPNGITVDIDSKRIFWVDAKRDYLASSFYDGKDLKYLLRGEHTPHPFAVAVHDNLIIFDDWILHKLLLFKKEDINTGKVIIEHVNDCMDLKIINYKRFKNDTNICNKNSTCSHLCIAKPYNSYRCVCPDDFNVTLTPDGNEICNCLNQINESTGVCQTFSSNITCLPNEFQCNNGKCISNKLKCDNQNDCGDHSDETNCSMNKCIEMGINFRCRNGNCIPIDWRCDHENDCGDGSDETLEECQNIYPRCDSPDEFRCKNYRCIEQKKVCNFVDDCLDGSDEMDCKLNSTTQNLYCMDNYFRCSNGACLKNLFVCDGDSDCLDGKDEMNCTDCAENEFKCPHGLCLSKEWLCDNDDDCADGSDEHNCNYDDISSNNTDIMDEMDDFNHVNNFPKFCSNDDWFLCRTGNFCIPPEWYCDGNNDCSDNSDELSCTFSNNSAANSNQTNETLTCNDDSFFCYQSNQCIQIQLICDGTFDCRFGEDERSCKYSYLIPPKCPKTYFNCLFSLGCIPPRKVCNGEHDCFDGSDEYQCLNSIVPVLPLNKSCSGFKCLGLDNECLPLNKRCDGKMDCWDGSDEENCLYDDEIRIFVPQELIKSDQFTIIWNNTKKDELYMPAYKLLGNDFFTEMNTTNSNWTVNHNYTFKNLRPGSKYQAFIYVMAKNDSVYPSKHYVIVTTLSIKPNPPKEFTAEIIDFNQVLLKWSKPDDKNITNYEIKHYRIYQMPPDPAITLNTAGNHIQLCCFEPDITYSFWATTVGENSLESDNSDIVSISVKPILSIEQITIVNITSVTLSLSWQYKSDKIIVNKWLISYSCEEYLNNYQHNITTNYTNATIVNLWPGVNYQLKLIPFINNRFRLEGIENNIVMAKTIGDQLPSIDVQTRVFESRIILQWSPPVISKNLLAEYNLSSAALIEWEYNVYIGDSIKNVQLYRKTNKTDIVLYLNPCHLYWYEVRISKPFGIGPAKHRNSIMTEYDSTAPPINLNIEPINLERTKYLVSWNASCSNANHTNVGYIVSVYDLIHNRQDRFRFQPRPASYHTFVLNIHYGAMYEIKVSTSNLNARWTKSIILEAPKMPKVPKPFGYVDDNGNINIIWRALDGYPNDFQNHTLEYIVHVYYQQNVKDGQKVRVKEPPAIIKPKINLNMYYIAVAIIDNHNYTGPISEIYSIQNDYFHHFELKSKNSSLIDLDQLMEIIFLIAILFIIILLIVLVAKKYQQTSIPFISSHYNCRLESATITNYDNYSIVQDDDNQMHLDDVPLVPS